MVGCYGHGSPALRMVGSQLEAAEEGQYQVSLAMLQEAPTNEAPPHEQWQQFFEERGACSFWEQLQQEGLCFRLEELKKEGVANEVVAGIIRYLAAYEKDQTHILNIIGDFRSESNQKLTVLDPAIGELTSLSWLNLENNALEDLPQAIECLAARMTGLVLSGNQFKVFPPAILNLKNLQSLTLINNQLKDVPEEIVKLTKLRVLCLANNQLKDVPPAIGQMGLGKLTLDCNQLTSLSEQLWPLFQRLKLQHNIAEAASIWLENPWHRGEPLLSRNKLQLIDQEALQQALKEAGDRRGCCSLLTICMRSVGPQAMEQLNQGGLDLKFLEESQEGCLWKEGKRIVFFDTLIPFHLDRQICNKTDFSNLEKFLQGKELYYLAEDVSVKE